MGDTSDYFLLLEQQKRQGNNFMEILAIHGNAQDSSIFGRLNIPNLKLIELPGHGTQEEIESYSINTYADFVEKQIGDNCIILGHSLGGHIALELAKRSSKVKGLISTGAPPLTLEGMNSAFASESIGVVYQEQPCTENIEKFCFAQNDTNNFVPMLKKMFSNQKSKARISLLENISTYGIEDELEKIDGLNIPSLFIFGKNEKLINLEYTRSLNLDNYVEVNGGHNIMLDNPFELEVIIKNFLTSVNQIKDCYNNSND